MAKKYARQAAERIAKRAIPNVRMLPDDARRFLARFVPETSVAAVHIYFPDPWWKKRHRKRRVFCEGFVVDVARILQPGGDFLIATDVEEYFGVMQRLMAEHPEFAPLNWPEPETPEHDQDYLTNFERKYRIEGRPIHRAAYKKRHDAGGRGESRSPLIGPEAARAVCMTWFQGIDLVKPLAGWGWIGAGHAARQRRSDASPTDLASESTGR